MKAILIDAERREIREVEYSPSGSVGGFPTIGDYLKGWIDVACRWDNGDVLYVDEEGYLKPSMHFFFCRFRRDQPMAGNGVLVGREIEDDDVPGGYYTIDPVATVEWLASQIVWMNRREFDRWALANAREPAITITTVDAQGQKTTEVIATFGSMAAGMARKEKKDDE